MKKVFPLFLSVLSGILLGAAWPTRGFPLLLFFAFIPLLWVEHDISKKKIRKKGIYIFFYSYLTFFIWNLLSIGWLRHLQPAFPAFPAAVGLNACCMSLVFCLFSYLKRKLGRLYGYFFLPMVWITFEKVHLNWGLSFPWLNLGNGFASYHQWVQWYEYTGVFGGTLWIWVVNIGLFFAFASYTQNRELEPLLRKLMIQLFIITLPVLGSLFIYKSYKTAGEGVKISVLQPNLDVYKEKFKISRDRMSDRLIALANDAVTPDTDYVVAPETSILGIRGIDLKNAESNLQLKKAAYFVKQHSHTLFIGGTSFYQLITDENQTTIYSNKISNANPPVWINNYNSAFQMGLGEKFQVYHKSKLVVGVETIPFPSILKPLAGKWLINLGGTSSTLSPQKKRSYFSNTRNHFKPGICICYESVYGEFVTGYVKNGANLLFVITNDGWWGNSEGPRQHLVYAKLRAIENRRSIAFSANTGISSFINQKGDLIAHLDYGKKGFLTRTLLTNERKTFYTQYGDLIARIAIFLTGVFLAVLFSRIVKSHS